MHNECGYNRLSDVRAYPTAWEESNEGIRAKLAWRNPRAATGPAIQQLLNPRTSQAYG